MRCLFVFDSDTAFFFFSFPLTPPLLKQSANFFQSQKDPYHPKTFAACLFHRIHTSTVIVKLHADISIRCLTKNVANNSMIFLTHGYFPK